MNVFDRVGAAVAEPGGGTPTRRPARSYASGPAAEQAFWDPVPCQMRLSKPGGAYYVHPIPGVGHVVDPNSHIIVWCECMAQSNAQLKWLEDGMIGPAPHPPQVRYHDALGAVRTVLPGERSQSGSRGRRSNPDAMRDASKIYAEHKRAREERIRARGASS